MATTWRSCHSVCSRRHGTRRRSRTSASIRRRSSGNEASAFAFTTSSGKRGSTTHRRIGGRSITSRTTSSSPPSMTRSGRTRARSSRSRTSSRCSRRAQTLQRSTPVTQERRGIAIARPHVLAPREVVFMPDLAIDERVLPAITRSNEWYARAVPLIPAATQTLAKGPGQYVGGVAPKYLQRGKGAPVWDVDGDEFIDLSMAIGPLSLGYAYEAVDRAIREQLEDGITFSMMHPLEVEVAELVREAVPNAEMVRYSKTGADVTSAAVRLARAFTGRSKVICCGYHGWHDWYISVTNRAQGVPKPVQDLTGTFNYNNIESVADALDGDTACAI